MTKKADLQEELLEKVKPGTKPSHLKRLKRSKSDSDIPPAPLSPKLSETEQLKKATDLNTLLTDQLKEKQQEIEALRKQLEGTNPSSNELSELDQSLMARHKSLKDWFIQYQENQTLETELAKNIEEASNELISQAKKISQLSSQNIRLKQTNQTLQRDLNLAQRLAELRKNYPFKNEPENSSGKYLLYGLLVLSLLSLLNSSWNRKYE